MTTLLYCLEGAHRKGFANAFPSLSDIQSEVLTRTVVSTVKKRKEETKEQKVQKQTENRETVFLPWFPSVVYLLGLLSLCPLVAAVVPSGQTLRGKSLMDE